MLLLHTHGVENGVFRGAYLETDYASFAAWRSWGRPPAGVNDGFAAAAIVSADGAYLLGIMGAHTLPGGQIYFPCGTPDPGDIIDGKVDLDFSLQRELKEETGLNITEFTAEPGWTVVADGRLLAIIKVLHSTQSTEVLQTRILAQLAREELPEFSDIRVVRGTSDFNPAMPNFVTAFLAQRFSGS